MIDQTPCIEFKMIEYIFNHLIASNRYYLSLIIKPWLGLGLGCGLGCAQPEQPPRPKHNPEGTIIPEGTEAGSGFWGMARARLTSPSWRTRWRGVTRAHRPDNPVASSP